METVEVVRRPTPFRLRDKATEPRSTSRVLDGSVVAVDSQSGEPAIVVSALPDMETAALRRMATTGEFAFSSQPERLSGITHRTASFGFLPRSPLRKRDCCSAAANAAKHPATQAELDRVTTLAEAELGRLSPSAYGRQSTAVGPIHREWRMGGAGLWTSGVLNDTAALAYHRDSGNVPRSWSAMLVLRRFVRGGLLHVPEYDVHLACSDRALVYFCGSDLLHGVTPLRRVPGFERRSYRFTFVWYAIAGMAACLPPAQELARGRKRRTERESRVGAR